MKNSRHPASDDIDQLMLNARLRDEIEPYLDDSLDVLNYASLPTRLENEYLASMLAWERAPILPISRWFEPELKLPRPDSLSNAELHELLGEVLHKLGEQRVVLEYTEHLSDRQLYCVILRDILPSYEKKVDLGRNYRHWHCLDIDADSETWLRFYATEQEREEWAAENLGELPPSQTPPYPRKLPRRRK